MGRAGWREAPHLPTSTSVSHRGETPHPLPSPRHCLPRSLALDRGHLSPRGRPQVPPPNL